MTQKRESQKQRQRQKPSLSDLFGLPSGGFVKPPEEGIFGQFQSIGAAFGAFGELPEPKRPDLMQFEESELRDAVGFLQEIYKHLESIKRYTIEIHPEMVDISTLSVRKLEESKKRVLESITNITEAITHKMSGETDGDKCPETAE